MSASLNLATASEAAGRLGISRSSLYAYVSRGLVRSFTSPEDPRERLYSLDDVDALVRRRTRLRRPAVAAATALDWGLPVLETGITRIQDGRLFYREVDAVEFAEKATLEEAACLLVGFESYPFAMPSPKLAGHHRPALGSGGLPARAIGLLCNPEPEPADLPRSVAAILRTMAAAAAGSSPGVRPIHSHLAKAWFTPDAADAIRRALVLCADHELSASAFAVRVAASTGASLRQAVIAGLATLSGPLHGGATDRARDFLRQAEAGHSAVLAAQGKAPPGFGHPLYPDGDPRAEALIGALPLSGADLRLLSLVGEKTGQHPSIDAALVLLERSFRLPEGAAFAIFAIGRTAGWLAHAVEQRRTGSLIRPRARYVLAEEVPASP
jgi:citrate synthase